MLCKNHIFLSCLFFRIWEEQFQKLDKKLFTRLGQSTVVKKCAQCLEYGPRLGKVKLSLLKFSCSYKTKLSNQVIVQLIKIKSKHNHIKLFKIFEV